VGLPWASVKPWIQTPPTIINIIITVKQTDADGQKHPSTDHYYYDLDIVLSLETTLPSTIAADCRWNSGDP